MNKISKILNSYHYNTLIEMASNAGLQVRSGGKQLQKKELMTRMEVEFFAADRIQIAWQQLSLREQRVLNRLLLHKDAQPTKSFRREIIRANLAIETPEPKPRPHYYRSGAPYDRDGYIGQPSRIHSTVFEDIIARLTFYGLVFSRGKDLGTGLPPFKVQFHPADILYVPQAVRQHLPEPEPIPASALKWQPEHVEQAAPALLLRDLYLYWDFVRRNKVSLLKSGLVGKRSLKAMNNILLIPDPLLDNASSEIEAGRLYLLRQLLEACGLLRYGKRFLQTTDQESFDIPEFWAQPQHDQARGCLDAWLTLPTQREEIGQAARYNPQYRQAKKTVIEILKRVPSDIWAETAEILNQAQMENVDFLFSEHSRIMDHRGRAYYSYSHAYYSGDRQTLLEEIEQLEIEFVDGCLEFLHLIGLVDLGYKGGQLTGVHLTKLGTVLLGIETADESTEPAEQETGRLVVQPSFQLLALGPVSLAMLAQLDLFADREQADQGAFAYRMSRESVYRAQQQGFGVSQVRHFLEQCSDTRIPQNVSRSLEEWEAHHERIVFRLGVSLLQTADAELLAAIGNDAHTGDHLAHSVAPAVALVKKGQKESLISALIERGMLLAVSDAKPDAADQSIIVHEDGTLQPIHAVPSLYLHSQLAWLAEETDKGEWALTPASIARAAGSKNKVLQLLDELTRLHRGELPNRLVEQIKAWGGYYGQAAAETLTLIEFRDRDTMEELMRHPDLQPYLTPFATKDRALAIVQSGQLEQVTKILKQLGVHTSHKLQDR